MTRVVVLGAGFGGLELTTRLSEAFGDDADVVLIDKSDGFVFGFSKLNLMFGRAEAASVHHAYAGVVKPGVRFVQATIRSIDPVAKRVETDAGPFDADILVVESGLTVDGWIPVDFASLETSFPGVYALGDVTSVGTPKAGVFAEGQALVAAERIIAAIRGGAGSTEYGGKGICWLEVGHDQVAKVDVTFLKGHAPTGGLDGPSPAYVADKVEFGTSRIARWFDPWNSTIASAGRSRGDRDPGTEPMN